MSNYEYTIYTEDTTDVSDTLFSLKESQEIIGDRNEILPTKIPSVNNFENVSLSSSNPDKINNSDVNVGADAKVDDCLELPNEEFDIEANAPIQEPLPVVNAPVERRELPGICCIIFLFTNLVVYVFITGFNII